MALLKTIFLGGVMFGVALILNGALGQTYLKHHKLIGIGLTVIYLSASFYVLIKDLIKNESN